MIACLVLAAGGGHRFGRQKLLAELDGMPLLAHALRAAASSRVERVCCVLGAEAGAIRSAVDLGEVEVVVCEQWQRGQAASLKAGIGALVAAEAVVVLMGDQPLVSAAAIDRIVAARSPEAPAVRATYGGAPSHPTLIERELFAAVGELDGDRGARELFEDMPVALIPCDDVASALDVDAPEDLAAVAELIDRRAG